ncbi:Serpin B6 like protein [Argiope bruennichi]|uniref:Serpin B6 like protein n=1 Tax=Argiope bruennichi TaxID=94029 RepID=A0A8T0EMK5_ARGBR|nr:Serpin B6 like protein [Argiope bruennichi]
MAIIKAFAIFFALCFSLTSAGVIFAPEELDRENLSKLSLANNELAFNLHRRLASGSSGNVFFSPLSISTAFGMLFYGARGNTAQELREALGYEKANLPNDLVHDTFNHFLREVLRHEDSSNGYVLKAANAVLVDKHLRLLEEYRNNVQEFYRAVVKDVDFGREAPRIVEEINSFVREKTNGKIEKLLDELSPSTVLVLLNAVYFKGTWKIEFDREETFDQIFYNYGLESERNESVCHIEFQKQESSLLHKKWPEKISENKVLANNELAFNLRRKLASDSSKNVFFSPASISTAFGMLLYGARGDTAEELRQALGHEKAELSNDLIHETFSHYFDEVLKSRDSSDGYVQKSANSILVDKHLELLEEYRRQVQELYKAVVRDVDFAKEAPRIVEEINEWVKEKTNGKIEKLLSELSLAVLSCSLTECCVLQGNLEN